MPDIASDATVKVAFVPTISNTAAPTTTELNAGTALEDFLTSDGGLGLQLGTDSVDTTAMSSTFNTSLPGRRTVETELTLKSQGRTAAPWTTFAGGVEGYLVVRRYVAASTAWTAAQKAEVYPVQAGVRKSLPPAANEVSKFSVKLFHTAAPVDATVA